MNERIRELSDQADAFARETVAYYRNEHDEYPDKLYEVSREKFAELIIRECAEVVQEGRWMVPPSQQQLATSIKQYFGVEQ